MKDGGPAFPRPLSHDAISENEGSNILRQGDHIQFEQAQDGMTLRDYFAAKAMQALVVIGKSHTHDSKEQSMNCPSKKAIVTGAYHFADAMLEARNK